MTEIEALKYAISHLKDSIEANPVLKVAGQASKAVKRLENMLQRETGMKCVMDVVNRQDGAK